MKPLFRASLARFAAQSTTGGGGSSSSSSSSTRTRAAARAALAAIRSPPLPYPVTATCPPPTCQCAPMPEGLEIDHSRSLEGTMSPYAQHLLISTGQSDWKSRIEDEKDSPAAWGGLVGEVKALLGRGGEFFDPYNNIFLGTSSFKPPEDSPGESTSSAKSSPPTLSSALIFPSFKSITNLPPRTHASSPLILSTLVRSLLLPQTHRLYIPYTPTILSELSLPSPLPQPITINEITTPTILICSHASRDSRCGVLGPLLRNQLVQYIAWRNAQRQENHEDQQLGAAHRYIPHLDFFQPSANTSAAPLSGSGITATKQRQTRHQHQQQNHPNSQSREQPVNIGLTSHVGGHVWAGNMIVYIPRGYTVGRNNDTEGAVSSSSSSSSSSSASSSSSPHPLAGKGIWYGRVEPRHIEGIFEETVVNGRVVRELLRGIAG